MKAIKLASVFAVSAVAAAVSTTTIAAEPVFSGTAGLSYNAESADKNWTSEGEVNISIDTGVIVTKLDMGGNAFRLDEAFVKQGAVSFGDFAGSISDDARYTAGVWEEGEYSDGSVTDLGVRYMVMDGLTVALEMQEGYDGVGAAVNYSQDLSGMTLGLSAGSFSGETPAGAKSETTNYSVGVKAPLGMATVIASYSGGETNSADFSTAVLGADVAVSDALSVSAQYSADLENELNNTEITAYYTAGDITYFATSLTGDKEATTLGAYASF